jgi:hypothetical protein
MMTQDGGTLVMVLKVLIWTLNIILALSTTRVLIWLLGSALGLDKIKGALRLVYRGFI